MNKSISLFSFALVCCLPFAACITKETPIPMKPAGEQISAQVDMGSDYVWQIFYSLKSNMEVGRSRFTAWDLGFETTAAGIHVILNSAKAKMAVYKTASQDFEAVSARDTIGVASQIDAPSGSLDSTGIGDWRDGQIYVLHRGVDESGKFLGMVKFRILAVSSTAFSLRFADINGGGDKTISIPKDENYNFSFLSFDDGGKQVMIEPPKQNWDIVFTKYTHIYEDLQLRYAVVGCLTNRFETLAARDSMHKDFNTIDITKALEVPLGKSGINGIGFDWKDYSIEANLYTTHIDKFYIIRAQDEIMYKLRFTDFYNDEGQKGAPSFEYQRL